MCSTCNCKRWTTNFTVACFFLAGGVEYSVILPTMFDYLTKHFDGKEWLYGLCLSAFSISNLFMGPLFGFVFDWTHRTKLIVLFANLFEIGGNFMYFAATSEYMVLGSRFVVGVGAGAGAAIFGDLARTTTKKERTTVFSVFMGLRQIGIVIGPAFNLFLRITDFYIGPFKVSKYTAPGAFMALVWVGIELMVLFLFFELPPVNNEEESGSENHPSPSGVVKPPSPDCRTNTDDVDDKLGHVTSDQSDFSTESKENSSQSQITSEDGCNTTGYRTQDPNPSDEKSPLLLPNQSMVGPSINRTPNLSRRGPIQSRGTSYGAVDDSIDKKDLENTSSLDSSAVAIRVSLRERVRATLKSVVWLLLEFLREEIVVLLAILFVTMFIQTAIEAMFVPMAENLFRWSELEISIFYSAAGVEIIIAFLVVMLLSRKVGDRWQLLVGLVLEVFGYAWMLGMIGNATNKTHWVLGKFIVGAVPILFGLPMFVATGASLYSKFLPMRIQAYGLVITPDEGWVLRNESVVVAFAVITPGFGQGIRRSVFSVAAILGPLWAGGAVAFSNYFVLLGVPCGLLLFIMVLTFLSFPKLKEPKKSKSLEKKSDPTIQA